MTAPDAKRAPGKLAETFLSDRFETLRDAVRDNVGSAHEAHVARMHRAGRALDDMRALLAIAERLQVALDALSANRDEILLHHSRMSADWDRDVQEFARVTAERDQCREALRGMLNTYTPGADHIAKREGEAVLHSAVIAARAALRACEGGAK